MKWNLSDAKNKFSELVNLAINVGPQTVNRRGDEVVVLSSEDYKKLIGKIPSFKQYLMEGPSLEGVELSRDKSSMREVDL